MKLNEFIKELEKIKKKQGGELEVTMADCIPVVEPVFYDGDLGKAVVITDQK